MARQMLKRTGVKVQARAARHARLRKKVNGSEERPRLCVIRTNRGLAVQLIDDIKGRTLFGLRTPSEKTANKNLANELGKKVAEQAKAKGITKVVFDRGGYIYHGRIAALAEGAREAGLDF